MNSIALHTDLNTTLISRRGVALRQNSLPCYPEIEDVPYTVKVISKKRMEPIDGYVVIENEVEPEPKAEPKAEPKVEQKSASKNRGGYGKKIISILVLAVVGLLIYYLFFHESGEVFWVAPGQVTDLIRVPDKSFIYFKSTEPFDIVERNLSDHGKESRIHRQAGRSQEWVKAGGILRVVVIGNKTARIVVSYEKGEL